MGSHLNKIFQKSNYAVALWFILFSLSLFVGASGFTIGDVFGDNDQQASTILFSIRLPRLIVASICGAALAVAGVISQGLFRNPLAGPTIIGTTSGANVLVVLLIFFELAFVHWLLQPLAAFVGALLSTSLLLKIVPHQSVNSTERLLLVGFALNSMFAAISTFLLSLSLNKYGVSQSIIYWLLGGCNGKGWEHIWMGLPLALVGLMISYPLCQKLNVINLGEQIALSLGVSINRVKIQGIIAISLLVGCSVAICGGIGFIGLIVPHITRLYIGAEHRKLMVSSLFNGMSLMIVADTIARTAWAPQEQQVGAILAILGAPTFVLLLLNQKRKVWL